jgi:S-adenosylmethionine:tRNA ribosyltransferase-isomerase
MAATVATIRWQRAPQEAPGLALATTEVARQAVRLLAIDRGSDRVVVVPFDQLPHLLRSGDLVVVNDAATLPGSLRGQLADGSVIELRLTGPIEGTRLSAVVLGEGDWRTRTEDRPAPPALAVGARLAIGGFGATVVSASGRRVELEVTGDRDALWQALYASGVPVQYAHRAAQLPLWSVQTAYAARPWAAEMPSAGRPLTWQVILELRRAGIELATLTHAAGLSSTGDPALDRVLPWPERYEIPQRTAEAIVRTRARRGRVIAIGTTVVRALEASGGEAGSGIARLRLDASHPLAVVDGLVSGLHVPGESHFELLRAFAPVRRLRHALAQAAVRGMSGHELGDACLIL